MNKEEKREYHRKYYQANKERKDLMHKENQAGKNIIWT